MAIKAKIKKVEIFRYPDESVQFRVLYESGKERCYNRAFVSCAPLTVWEFITEEAKFVRGVSAHDGGRGYSLYVRKGA